MIRMVDFEQRVPGTRPEICPISPEIGLGIRPAKVLKEALQCFITLTAIDTYFMNAVPQLERTREAGTLSSLS